MPEVETPATTEPVVTPEPAAAAPTPPEAPADAVKAVWESPETAKAEIERLRRENAKDRTTAKETAAEEARAAFAQTIGKALGLVKDDAPVDPAALSAQITTAQTEAKQAKVALAVYQNADAAGADPSALLDSASFLAKVGTLDPTDTAAITAAMQAAVAANPRYGNAPVAPATHPGMKPNPAQGRSDSPPLGVQERIAAAQATNDIKTVMRLKAAQAIQQT